ncbi:hypothetical protein Tco_1298243 [Tanacetum coccineum]
MFQHLGRYPTSVRVFHDPILFFAGLKSSWEHGQQRPAILKWLSRTLSTPQGTFFGPRPLVKRKLAPGSSTSHATRAKTSSSKEDVPFLTVSDDDEGLPDVLKLKDATASLLKISAITPPAWKNHMDNHMDLELIDLYDHCHLGVRQAVVDNVLKGAAGYQQSLSTLESKVTSLEVKKARLEAIKVSLRKEVEELKQDRRGGVFKASNALATTTFPWLDEFVADPSTPIEALLSKKPLTLQRPAPSRT